MHDIFDMQRDDYDSVIDLTSFEPGKLATDHVDQHFAVLDDSNQIRARCSIWWRNCARVGLAATGLIGHYAATDEKSGRAVLSHACRELRNRHCEVAVGPMDGSTWKSYRFVTKRGDSRPFFLEPDNPDEWPLHFARHGFRPVARYVSEINPHMSSRQPELGNLRNKMLRQGISISSLDKESSAGDLDGIYAVVRESFRNAFMYTPLERDCFRNLYAPLLREVDHRLVLLAKQHDEVVGFVFAPPDFLQQNYQERIDAIVIKTVAILPRDELSGLGRVLLVELLQNAVSMGFSTAISALMHIGNRSQKISSACAGPMREYSLYAKELQT